MKFHEVTMEELKTRTYHITPLIKAGCALCISGHRAHPSAHLERVPITSNQGVAKGTPSIARLADHQDAFLVACDVTSVT
jgi:hypothetical protein